MNENEKLREKQMEDQNLQQLSNEELKEKIEKNIDNNNNSNVVGPSTNKSSGGTTALIVILIIVGLAIGFYFIIWPDVQNAIPSTWDKPVLYIYPEEDMDVNISFDNEKVLKTTYPKYNDGWEVHVKSDGSITDNNGRGYYALYWDEEFDRKVDFSTGFYVKSEDSIKFLEEKLNEIGLTEREANEFIMYCYLLWKRMEII